MSTYILALASFLLLTFGVCLWTTRIESPQEQKLAWLEQGLAKLTGLACVVASAAASFWAALNVATAPSASRPELICAALSVVYVVCVVAVAVVVRNVERETEKEELSSLS